MIKNNLIIISLLLFALLARFWLTDKAWHVDMLSNAGWGEWIVNHGTKGFYENSNWTYSWPTQPPVTNLIYAFNKQWHTEILGRLAWTEFQSVKIIKLPWLSNFVEWFGYGRVNLEVPYQIGYMVTMKLLPILADIGIGIAIYFLTNKKWQWAAVYLISPFSWYISAMWGQYDGVGFLFALLAIMALRNRMAVFIPLLLSLAIFIKPTSLIIAPIIGYMFLRNRKLNFLSKSAGILLAVGLFWFTTTPFTYKNPFIFARHDLKRIIFEKSEPRLSVNSFNFWRIFTGNTSVNANYKLLGIPASWWGVAGFAIINIMAILMWEKHRSNPDIIWPVLFLSGTGSFLFMTGMLERYLFAGIVFGLLAAVRNRRLVVYWLIMSGIFWLNLYYHWWVPENLAILKGILEWNADFVTRILSAVNVILYVMMARIIYQEQTLPKQQTDYSQISHVHSAQRQKKTDDI